MVVDQGSLVDIIEKLFKKLGISDKSVTCDELIKKGYKQESYLFYAT